MITRKTTARARSVYAQKGFTLTEIAIVLGIIGLILGAIWVAAAGVYSSQKVNRANTEMLTVAQGIRTLYASSSTTGSTDGSDITSAICSAGIFPSDMYAVGACGTVFNPWSGTNSGSKVYATSVSAASAQDGFEIVMTGVPATGCVSLLTGLGTGSAGSGGGLYYINASSGATVTYTPGSTNSNTPQSGSGNLMNAGTAATACSSATSNTVAAVFKLKG